ncbi:MAG: hypothetical protein KKF44_08435 [Nanoarchaeota archaeon]|nr:hypothetical protein [Nanoarchaeota archaeon]
MKDHFDEVKIKIDKLDAKLDRLTLHLSKNIMIMDWKLNLILRNILKTKSGLLFSREELKAFKEVEDAIIKKEKMLHKKEKKMKTEVEDSFAEKEWKKNIMHTCDLKFLHYDEIGCHSTNMVCNHKTCPKNNHK